MIELLRGVVSWPSLVSVIVVFGFAPKFCLRLMVLAYPRSDPRRSELIAELEVVPRIERPLWVAEQLEVALSEGIGHRVSAAIRRLTGRRREQRRRKLLMHGVAVMFGTALLGDDQRNALLRCDLRSALPTSLPPGQAERLAVLLDRRCGVPLSRQRRRFVRAQARTIRCALLGTHLYRWRRYLRVHAATIRRRLVRQLRR